MKMPIAQSCLLAVYFTSFFHEIGHSLLHKIQLLQTFPLDLPVMDDIILSRYTLGLIQMFCMWKINNIVFIFPFTTGYN